MNGPNLHTGRSFSGHAIEDGCPCPKERCGLVDISKAVPECEHHGIGSSKTIRQMHSAFRCPARTQLKVLR